MGEEAIFEAKPPQQRYGATAAEWAHWDLILDLGRDLLPTVSDPDVSISPASNMKALGKVPSRLNRQRQASGIPEWPLHVATSTDIDAWSKEPAYGICLITRAARALDIDITNAAKALEIRKCITDHLGQLPMRSRSNSSKVLFLFMMLGDIPKRVIKTAHGQVELLGSRQQAVVAGTHPSGARYEWLAGLPSELRVVTPEELDTLWSELERRFASEPSTTARVSTKAEKLAEAAANDPVAVALYEKGLVTGTAPDGKLFVECPFSAEHARETDITSTAYFPANTGGYARGSFRCLHSACEGRSASDFLNAIGIVEDHRDDFDAVVITSDATGATVEWAIKFVFVDAHEFAGGKPLRWFVKGVLPWAEFGVVYGPPGSGKSFFVLDLCMAIARGMPWRGHKVNGARVGYIAAEGAGGFRNRIQAYLLANSLKSVTLKVLAAAPNLLNKADVVALGHAIQAVGGLDLIVYDTLARGTVGGDENSAKDMGLAIANCQALHKVTGAMIVLVHHSGKDASRGARGSTAILGANDIEIEITRAAENRTARISKIKDGDCEGEQFGFVLKALSVGMDEEGDDISSCIVEHGEAVTPPKARKLGLIETRVWDVVLKLRGPDGSHPTVKEVITATIDTWPTVVEEGKRDTRPQHIRRALKQLEARVMVKVEAGRVAIGAGSATI